jgi:GNAT superfamily N-acetyltransferase
VDELFHIRSVSEIDYPYIVTLLTEEGLGIPLQWREGTAAVNDDDELVGYIYIQRTAVGSHVAPIAVFSGWRGRGVGQALIQFELERNKTLKLVARGDSVGFYRALEFSEISFCEISDELEEDCNVCMYREECGPVAFIKHADKTS